MLQSWLPAQTPIYQQSFESQDHGWTISGASQIWTYHDSDSPSASTGPEYALDGDFYFFTESSGTHRNNKTAHLTSPVIRLPNNGRHAVSFGNHLYGTTMGTLKLSVRTTDGAWAELWSKSGNHDDIWFRETVDLSAYRGRNIKLRFTGITGSSYTSDMAVDDITIHDFESDDADELRCNFVITAFPYRESFERGDGSWIETPGRDLWRRTSSGTPSGSTGPSRASDGSYYQYTEASSPNTGGKENFFTSPCFSFENAANASMTFDYHMYGYAMGEIEVQAQPVTGGPWQSLWHRKGDQGRKWLKASLDLTPLLGGQYRFRLRGRTGTQYTGDAAIDNLVINSTPAPTLGGGWGTVVSSFPYTEDFERNLGSWTSQGTSNIFTRRSGSTPSRGTGPIAAFSGSYYVYTETSSPNYGRKRAYLTGPTMDLRQQERAEMYFNYHAQGANINRLRLQVSIDAGRRWRTVWTQAGEDPDGPLTGQWHEAAIDLTEFAGRRVRLRFLTVTGDSYLGDIAFDNLRVVIPEDETNVNGLVLFLPQGTDYDHSNPELGDRVENVLVRVKPRDGRVEYTAVTDFRGMFSVDVLTGLVDLVPEVQEDNFREGIGIEDVSLLRAHIDGSQKITDPVSRLAADVNRDGVLDMADVDELERVLIGDTGGFREATSWQLVADFYLRDAEKSFHPDPIFLADFWNSAYRNAQDRAYPYVAKLNLPGRQLIYGGEDDWVGQLANWQLDAGAAEACRPPANFILFKTGDISRNARPHTFAPPTPEGTPGLADGGGIAKNDSEEKSGNKRLMRLTNKLKHYEVSVFATSRRAIFGFQTALRYDPELIRVRGIQPNASDLYRGPGGRFTDLGRRVDPVVRTIWSSENRRGRRFERDEASRADDLSEGKLLYRLDIEAYANRRQVAAAIGLSMEDLPTQFRDRQNRLITNIDIEVYITKASKGKDLLTEKSFGEEADNDAPAALSIYPNPVRGTLRYELTAPERCTHVRLIDAHGKELTLQPIDPTAGNHQQLPVTAYRPGVYYLEALGETGVVGSARVIIIR